MRPAWSDKVMENPDRLPELLDKHLRLFVVATGAGSGIQNELWAIPGASAFFVGAQFPYSTGELDRFLGEKPTSYASPETALSMAIKAYERALDGSSTPAVGLALTGSVASLKEHRGDHRLYICVVTDQQAVAVDVQLRKNSGAYARQSDGFVADNLALALLKHTVLGDSTAIDAVVNSTSIIEDIQIREVPRETLSQIGLSMVPEKADIHQGAAIFPGAFNPPHQGHLDIANRVASNHKFCIMTICVNPPHKDHLTIQDILRRRATFDAAQKDSTVILQFTKNDPLYIDKARKYPGHYFVMGADALIRMLDPKWGTEIEPMLDEFRNLRTRFNVFGRVVEDKFVSAEQAISMVPDSHRFLFVPVKGRWDLSSTDIRKAQS